MVKNKNEKTYWIIGVIVILLVMYGGSLGLSNSKFSVVNQYDNLPNTQNYYCCSSVNGYSCSLNSCAFGTSKVYTGSFNTLDSCNNKCLTPTNIQPPIDSSLTCAQKAAQLNALFYVNPVSTAKECLDFAILDCQDTGKILDGYGVSGTCCYYTCVAVAPVENIICHDSDSNLATINLKLQTRGTCHDNTQEIQDSCDGEMLKEYYCEADFNGLQVCGYTSFNCDGMIPGTSCQNGYCINLV